MRVTVHVSLSSLCVLWCDVLLETANCSAVKNNKVSHKKDGKPDYTVWRSVCCSETTAQIVQSPRENTPPKACIYRIEINNSDHSATSIIVESTYECLGFLPNDLGI